MLIILSALRVPLHQNYYFLKELLQRLDIFFELLEINSKEETKKVNGSPLILHHFLCSVFAPDNVLSFIF